MDVESDVVPQDEISSSQREAQPSTSTSKFRPYASTRHRVTKGRYITSNDPRGYIPVYEYPLNGLWIMMDIDDGYILWTGIWKALGNAKADIVKMLESQPDLTTQLRRVRGGYLKIQGTWMPYEVALRLARRVAWPIREDLIPLFGPNFPSTCLSPGQPGYGQIGGTPANRRRPRRTFLSPLESTISSQILSGPSTNQAVRSPVHTTPDLPPISGILTGTLLSSGSRQKRPVPSPFAPGYSGDVIVPSRSYHSDANYIRPSESLSSQQGIPGHSVAHRLDASSSSYLLDSHSLENHQETQEAGNFQSVLSDPSGAVRMRGASQLRYEPYGSGMREKAASTSSSPRFPPLDATSTSVTPRLPPLSLPKKHQRPFTAIPAGTQEQIHLPPLRTIDPSTCRSMYYSPSSDTTFNPVSLPPISSLDGNALAQSTNMGDSAAVLRRLTLEDDRGSHRNYIGPNYDDDDNYIIPTQEQLRSRRRSLSAPPYKPTTLSAPVSSPRSPYMPAEYMSSDPRRPSS